MPWFLVAYMSAVIPCPYTPICGLLAAHALDESFESCTRSLVGIGQMSVQKALTARIAGSLSQAVKWAEIAYAFLAWLLWSIRS